MGTAIAYVWLSSTNVVYRVVFTVYLLVAFVVLGRFVVTFETTRDLFHFWGTERFLDETTAQKGHPSQWIRLQSYAKRNRLWRLIKNRGAITAGSLLVVMAPLTALWAQRLDTGLKLGITLCLILVALAARIAFVGHVPRRRQEAEEVVTSVR